MLLSITSAGLQGKVSGEEGNAVSKVTMQ